MPGRIGLIGGEEFEPAFDPIHAQIFELLGLHSPRTVFFPTAAALDGPGVAAHWAELASQRLAAAGARVSPLMVLDRPSAQDEALAEQAARADLIYLGGGLPQVYLEILGGSRVWQALARAWAGGTPILAASAGAMILGEICLVAGEAGDYPPSQWAAGFNLLARTGIAPHFDVFPPAWIEKIIRTLPAGCSLTGIDESTALLLGGGEEIVLGKGKIHRFQAGA